MVRPFVFIVEYQCPCSVLSAWESLILWRQGLVPSIWGHVFVPLLCHTGVAQNSDFIVKRTQVYSPCRCEISSMNLLPCISKLQDLKRFLRSQSRQHQSRWVNPYQNSVPILLHVFGQASDSHTESDIAAVPVMPKLALRSTVHQTSGACSRSSGLMSLNHTLPIASFLRDFQWQLIRPFLNGKGWDKVQL